MRVVFFGTPEVAVPSLRALLDASEHQVTGVVTQPDRVRGRGRTPTPSPVKTAAVEAGLVVLQPGSPKDEGFAEALEALEPEVLCIVAYGHILPRAVLAVAPAMNVHFSLLPRYRGAAPVQRALMDGATETGVSVFLLEPTVDTGPVLRSERVAIGDEETAGELLDRLAPVGARLLLEALTGYAAGVIVPEEQDDAAASPAPKIDPAETSIDWALPAQQIVNRIRGLSPRPGAHTTFKGRRLSVLRARATEGDGVPGTVIRVDDAGPVIAAGADAVVLTEVQPEGKRAMTGADFGRGYRPASGSSLGG